VKITLISLDREIMCMGIRILSACLKKEGHETQLIFLALKDERWSVSRFSLRYSEQVLSDIVNICRGSNLIGLSLMSNQYLQAIEVTSYLKEKLEIPVVWGGIHPTVAPDECLDYADMVCVGEAEDALLELVSRMSGGKDYYDVRNFFFRSGEEIIRNAIRPLIQDLDTIPFPDYEMDGHFLLDDDRITELDKSALLEFDGERFRSAQKFNGLQYPIMASRGCPYSCTYCCNNYLRKIYEGQKYLRRRSVKNVIDELVGMKTKVAEIGNVFFVDDNFTAVSSDYLKEFCESYKERVAIPFFCQCSPLTISEEKMNLVAEAGCFRIAMGVETGSARIAQMYNRSIFHKRLKRAIRILEKFRSPTISPCYYFIVDNPYETIEDTAQTLAIVLQLPKRDNIDIHSLMLFPGTELFQKAREDGLLVDEMSQIYRKDWFDYRQPFLRFWLKLYRSNVPSSLLRLFLDEKLTKLAGKRWLDRIFSWGFLVLNFLSRVNHLLKETKAFLHRNLFFGCTK
jgi:anaerobic magnesium-protoporphyrin IX monomethyl ester cyclase